VYNRDHTGLSNSVIFPGVKNRLRYLAKISRAVQELRPGDVIRIPANVKHWHGAAKDSWFARLSIETNCQAGPAEWLEPVSTAEYAKLK